MEEEQEWCGSVEVVREEKSSSPVIPDCCHPTESVHAFA